LRAGQRYLDVRRDRDVEINLCSPHDYLVEMLDELPDRKSDPFRFSGPSHAKEDPALLICCKLPGGHSWVASFVFGYDSPPAACGVYSWTAPSEMLVVAGGQSYVVPVNAPVRWRELDDFPITKVLFIADMNCFVVGTLSGVAVFDASGLRWRRRVGSELLSVSVKERHILADGWSAARQQSFRAKIEPSSGLILEQQEAGP
jgi:hypothetical protein